MGVFIAFSKYEFRPPHALMALSVTPYFVSTDLALSLALYFWSKLDSAVVNLELNPCSLSTVIALLMTLSERL